METILIPAVLSGFISSIIIEIFKFIPWLAESDTRKQITSFVVTLAFILFYIPTLELDLDFLGLFIIALTSSYATYKTFLKPITKVLGFAERLGEN